jgi:hypothetical protein
MLRFSGKLGFLARERPTFIRVRHVFDPRKGIKPITPSACTRRQISGLNWGGKDCFVKLKDTSFRPGLAGLDRLCWSRRFVAHVTIGLHLT